MSETELDKLIEFIDDLFAECMDKMSSAEMTAEIASYVFAIMLATIWRKYDFPEEQIRKSAMRLADEVIKSKKALENE